MYTSSEVIKYLFECGLILKPAKWHVVVRVRSFVRMFCPCFVDGKQQPATKEATHILPANEQTRQPELPSINSHENGNANKTRYLLENLMK